MRYKFQQDAFNSMMSAEAAAAAAWPIPMERTRNQRPIFQRTAVAVVVVESDGGGGGGDDSSFRSWSE